MEIQDSDMCINPIRLKQTNDQPVPCGNCPVCRKRLAQGWSFRLMQEVKKSDSALFLTLTYGSSNVPFTRAGYMDLSKRDCQLFFKRLRKSQGNKGNSSSQIKYFLVGEYGGRTKRPHYHVILLNAQVELVQDAWQLGQIHYGTVTEASVYYTLKYMLKPTKKQSWKSADDRTQQFRLMSKGLGADYARNKRFVKWHQADLENRMYCNLEDGKKIAMPRYYKDRIYDAEQREIVSYAALERNRALATKDEKTPEQKRQLILSLYFAAEFASRSRCKV